MAIYICSSHKKGISSYQLGRDLGICQKTAWFILHRIRYAFGNGNYILYWIRKSRRMNPILAVTIKTGIKAKNTMMNTAMM